MKLKIEPDFRNLVQPLSTEEFEQLKQNILSEKRCREAILIWKGYIVDGYNRYEICLEHKIPFKVSKMHFESKNDALIWIAENQLGRRNLSDAVRIEIAIERARLLALNKPIKFRKTVAEAAGLSEQTVYKYMKVVGSGNVELVERLRRGEVKISAAFKEMKAETKILREINIGSKWYLEIVSRIFKVYGACLGVSEAEGYAELRFVGGCFRRIFGSLDVGMGVS